ncbi:hypothetical protein ACP4OV_026851 [Aristida adscensionis]
MAAPTVLAMPGHHGVPCKPNTNNHHFFSKASSSVIPKGAALRRMTN